MFDFNHKFIHGSFAFRPGEINYQMDLMIGINDDLQTLGKGIYPQKIKVLHVAFRGNQIALYGSVTEGIKLK